MHKPVNSYCSHSIAFSVMRSLFTKQFWRFGLRAQNTAANAQRAM